MNSSSSNGGEATRETLGHDAALKIAESIIGPLFDLNQPDLEILCVNALELSGDKTALAKHETHKTNQRKQEKKTNISSSGLDFSMTAPTATQLKNQAMRFGLDQNITEQPYKFLWPFGSSDSKSVPSSSSGSRNSSIAATFFGTAGGNDDMADYEEVIDPEILAAPICEVCIVQRGEAVPKGYHRLSKTPKNKKANLNAGSGGHQLFLCILKDRTQNLAPITAISVIFPDKSDFMPPGFQVVKRDNVPCNLNSGTAAERVFLCYKKDWGGNPLVDLQLILPGKGEEAPKNYSMVDKSPSGRPANLNATTGGGVIFLCYRQELSRLQCLANDSAPTLHKADSIARGLGGEKLKMEKSASNSGMGLSSIASKSTDSMLSAGSSMGDEKKMDWPEHGHVVSTGGNRIRAETEESNYDANDTGSLSGFSPNSVLNVDTRTSEVSKASAESPVNPVVPISISSLQSVNSVRWEEVPGVDEEVQSEIEASTADSASVDYLPVKDRRTQVVVDASGQMVSAICRRTLLALLSALYLRQANVADTVLKGLTMLLKDTDFFEGDLTQLQLPSTLTMLDVTIEAMCDRVDMCKEAEYPRILTFLQALIKHSGGRLSPSSLQRVFRTLSFLIHMSATRSSWMRDNLPMPLESDTGDINAFKVLRDLVWAVVAQVETAPVAHYLPDDTLPKATSSASSKTHDTNSTATEIAHEFVLEFIEEVIDCVEVSRIAEACQLTISKQSSSTASAHFWQQVSILSKRLFTEQAHRSAFIILCATTKLAWHDIRSISSGTPMPRDLGGKLLAQEALLEICLSAGEKMRVSKIMGYMIRRLVVPCILYNVQFGLKDHRVFSKIMRLITSLWKVWRSHVRIEFALLVEQIVIRVLQADILTVRPVYQMIVIQEVVTWFDQPHLLVEMFVNYDMDRKFVSQWNIFSYLIRAVCATARRVNVVTGAWDWRPRTESADDVSHTSGGVISIRSVHMQALEEVGRIAKTLMDATGHAYLMMQDANFRYKTLGAGAGWEEDDEDNDIPPAPNSDDAPSSPNSPIQRRPSGVSGLASVDSHDSGGSGRITNGPRGARNTVKFRRAVHQEAEELLQEAIKIYEEKGSLLKAVRFLISKNFMADTPQEIASFLRVYKNSLDPSAIGDFLGEGGRTPAENEYWAQIRFRYTRAVSFVEMDLEPALRMYLTGCGFRLPGEAQKVDRFVEVFVKTFWQDNSGTPQCPFSHPDTAHLVTYAIIMLNTDHHRANLSKSKARSKMTREQFIANLRGADKDHDINRDYLCRIFDNVQAEAIELAVEASESSGSVGFNAGRGARNNSVFQSNDGLSALSMLTFRPTFTSQDLSMQEEQKFFREITRTLRDSEDLLRSLSPFAYRFQLTGVDTNISMDLVSFMYETVWFHFRAITDSLLQYKGDGKSPGGDMYVIFIALDILCYSLTASIFLGLKVEAMTFAEQLARFITDHCGDGQYDDTWLADVSDGVPEIAMETIAKVHTLMVKVKDNVQESANREETRTVAARIEKKANVLQNNSFFVREGDLAKRNRNGRFVSYRFFLFSDHLIYAHQGLSGEYKVHGQLHLTQMNVTDLVTDANKCSMYVSHPTKSFVVVADSAECKQQWMRDLHQTILNCKKRVGSEAPGRGRNQSFLDRIEAQQIVQLKELAINSPSRDGREKRDGGIEYQGPVIELSFSEQSPSERGTHSASFALMSGSETSSSDHQQTPISSPEPVHMASLSPSP